MSEKSPSPASRTSRRFLATFTDQSQGVPLAKMQELVRYWKTDYDWRKVEARLNALPNFVTEIDGLDIHFIHVRSRHPNALPLFITHGWPGSILELVKVIGPLTDPTAHRNHTGYSAMMVTRPQTVGYGLADSPADQAAWIYDKYTSWTFPGEIYRAPRSWGDRSSHNLIYWNEVDWGGHFAAWEEPELFSAEVRAAFRSLR